MDNTNLLIKVSEQYYLKKWTQQKIADELGVSRASISRLLDEAREKGIVEIKIKVINNRNNVLEHKLKDKFNLKDIIVFESVDIFEYDLESLGRITAQYFTEIMKDGYSVGISWGQSVQSFISNIPSTSFSNTTVTQLNGGIKGSTESRFVAELVITLGSKLNASYHLLDAPAYVSNVNFKNELLNQPQIVDAFEEMKKLDVVVTGVGDLKKKHNSLYNAGILRDQDVRYLEKHDVAGHILGRMYNRNGEEVNFEDKYAIAMPLEDLRNVPYIIAAVITESRAEATRVAIEANLVNILICDNRLAERLLIDD